LLEYEFGLRCWREISELKSFATTELYADVTSQAIQGLKIPLGIRKLRL
jgi:hypothetical protein